ncbi:hypothetical protein H6G17_20855 [Chroococcidiopsis sp. FACHB-1243]|nr:hypothetical protein [Chroococcidiopsis sp. [FACHB-1243]]
MGSQKAGIVGAGFDQKFPVVAIDRFSKPARTEVMYSKRLCLLGIEVLAICGESAKCIAGCISQSLRYGRRSPSHLRTKQNRVRCVTHPIGHWSLVRSQEPE